MKKEKLKAKHVEPLAKEFKTLYESFLMNGFTTDQAFQLLLAVIKKQVV